MLTNIQQRHLNIRMITLQRKRMVKKKIDPMIKIWVLSLIKVHRGREAYKYVPNRERTLSKY
jgi:hypothetical protein